MTVFISDQELLDLIRSALSSHLQHPDFKSHLSTIKSLFYKRDYQSIFTSPRLLGAYAAEYIPHRSLCYRSLFQSISDLNLQKHSKILCLGAGNGAELMGIAGALKETRTEPLQLWIQDMADYGILEDLKESLFKMVDPLQLQVHSIISDLLVDAPALEPLVSQTSLVTAFFLLNELFATSKAGFASLISMLIHSLSSGSLFLVIDSAGSFSEAQVGSHTHMIFRFLDGLKDLSLVHSQDAVWYRVAKELRYPTKLNHMRHFVRLYRRI